MYLSMRTRQAPIGHLDADAFYVSAERVRYEHLVGLPVGVLGNQGACVIAKSYEMKSHGIKTGMPIWDALRLCPDGFYVKRDFKQRSDTGLKIRGKPRCRQRLVLKPIPWVEPPKRLRARL
jgi:nucleotidyltransferase/DNA polymerase involved in DNA repair